MQKALQPKRSILKPKGALLQDKRYSSSQQYVTKEGQYYKAYWDISQHRLSTPPLLFVSTSSKLQKKQRPISAALWFNEFGGWLIVLVMGAYIMDDVFNFRGYLLAAVWLLICLPILTRAAIWIKSRKSQVR